MLNSKPSSIPDHRSVIDTLRRHADDSPSRRIFRFLGDGENETDQLTCSQLDLRARAIAARMQERGKPGDRALLVFEPGLDFITAFYGCLYAGVIAVPVYPPDPMRIQQTLPRFRGIVADARPAFVLCSEFVFNAMRAGLSDCAELCEVKWLATDILGTEEADSWRHPRMAPEALGFLQYTSGTTATPKGVQVTFANIAANSAAIQRSFGHNKDTVVVSWLPVYHDMGLIGNVLHTVDVGATNVLMSPIAFLQRPFRWLRAISQFRANTSGGPNFGYDLCTRKVSLEQRSSLDLSCWDVAYNGAEPIRARTLDSFVKKFAPCGFRRRAFFPCYGLAEATLIVSGGPRLREPVVKTIKDSAMASNRIVDSSPDDQDSRSIISCGQIHDEETVVIVDPEQGTRQGNGEVGEIWLRGANVAAGYWANPDQTRETFEAQLEEPEDEGTWMRTGDLGFEEGGELYVTGRLKDLLIIRGRNHYPQDIEWTVENCHELLRPGCTAAFSVEVQGQERLVLVAEVSDNPQPDHASALFDAIRGAVLEIHGLDVHTLSLLKSRTIPKTSSGKVQRRACHDAYIAGELEVIAVNEPPPPLAPVIEESEPHQNPNMADRVIEAISGCIPRGDRPIALGPSTTFRGELGLDSLATVELLVRVEKILDIKLDPSALNSLHTIEDLVLAVDSAATGDGEPNGVTGIGNLKERMLKEIPQLCLVVEEQRGREVLVDGRWRTDFASANYLGLDLHPRVMASIPPAIERWGVHPSWTPVVAAPQIHRDLENDLAAFVGAEEVIVFATVTLLHLGVLPLLAGEDGVILLDQAAHNSVHEAALLASTRGTALEYFSHDSLDEIEEALKRHQDRPHKIIAVDGVYSMLGSYAPLKEYAALAKKYDARIYVDDAHGFGVIGEAPSPEFPWGRRGNGLVKHQGLSYAEDRIVYVSGLSKAFSSMAAFVTCNDLEEKALLCGASTWIFSGPCPTASLASAIEGLKVCDEEGAELRGRLWELSRRLVHGARDLGFTVDNHDFFPLAGVVVGDLNSVVRGCQILWEHGILITPALFPAVPLDRGMLRFTTTAANTEAQVDQALEALRHVRDNLGVKPVHQTARTVALS